jgi:hypothetical protein
MKTFLRSCLAVVWAFFGIRNSSEAKKDAVQITPIHIAVVGISLTIIFIIGLMLIIKVVVGV